jgi:hypothetical protein
LIHLAIRRNDWPLDCLQPPDGARRVGDLFFGDEFFFAPFDDLEIVTIGTVRRLVMAIEIGVGLSEDVFNRCPVGFGQRLVYQGKPASSVLCENETRIKIDHLTQEEALLLNFRGSFLNFGFEFAVDALNLFLSALSFTNVADDGAENIFAAI